MARILYLVPYYRLVPPRNGGTLRCFHLLQALARRHEVHVVALQSAGEMRAEAGRYVLDERTRIYSPLDIPAPASAFDLLPRRVAVAARYRWLTRSMRGPADSFILAIHHLLHLVARRTDIDVVICTNLQTMAAAPTIRQLWPRALRILNADNVEHTLREQEQAFAERETGPDEGMRRQARRTLQAESRLYPDVSAVIACSDVDAAEFRRLNGPRLQTLVIPNGVDAAGTPYDTNRAKRTQDAVLFCGSLNYLPNEDGLGWFHREVWPRVRAAKPNMRLIVVGHGGPGDRLSSLAEDPSVELVGEVPEVLPYYLASSISIVPLRMGSGTRLKALEAMSAGNPVVSTSHGVEGLALDPGEHLLIADEPSEFASALLALSDDEALYDGVRARARKMVEASYDWTGIGDRMSAAIERMLQT